MSLDTKIRCIPFNAQSFSSCVRDCLGVNGSWELPPQLNYLLNYLADQEVNAKTLVVEPRYTDRHYMEEHGAYYSRCFSAPPNYGTRLHAFSSSFDDPILSTLMEMKDTEAALRTFVESYLGFIVLRPLPETPVGRTMLKPFPEKKKNGNGALRFFGPQIKRTVHLGSLTLTVAGLPFQQQDYRVGACATTAIWCSLAKMTHADGGRTPTPSQITEAAVRYHLPGGRAYPSAGLNLQQMCEALRSLAASPELILFDNGEPEDGIRLLRSYLRSEMAPILALFPTEELEDSDKSPVLAIADGDGHAVTLAGYRTKSDPEAPLNQFDFERIYIHDDRTGPYSRAKIGLRRCLVDGCLKDSLVIQIDAENWIASHMIVPLYPKLRASMSELFDVANFWCFPISMIVRSAEENRPIDAIAPDQFNLNDWEPDARFTHSGSYLSSLRIGLRANLPAGDIGNFCRRISLSRYVGVAEFYYKNSLFAHLLWDTTDRISAGAYSSNTLLGAVCFSNPHRHAFVSFMNDIDVVCI